MGVSPRDLRSGQGDSFCAEQNLRWAVVLPSGELKESNRRQRQALESLEVLRMGISPKATDLAGVACSPEDSELH